MEIRLNVPMPPTKRSGGIFGRYPIDSLPEPTTDENGKVQYASFGVADRDEKQMKATIYQAQKRYATPVVVEVERMNRKTKKKEKKKVTRYNPTRQFRVVAVDPKNDVDGAKCRVYRVA